MFTIFVNIIDKYRKLLYIYRMYIVNTETGDRVEVVIEPMQKKDYNAVAQT